MFTLIIIFIIETSKENYIVHKYIAYQNIMHHDTSGAGGSTVDSGTALHAGRSRVRLPTVSLEFFSYIILPAAVWPWSRLSL